jgi:hypothetical protein
VRKLGLGDVLDGATELAVAKLRDLRVDKARFVRVVVVSSCGADNAQPLLQNK